MEVSGNLNIFQCTKNDDVGSCAPWPTINRGTFTFYVTRFFEIILDLIFFTSFLLCDLFVTLPPLVTSPILNHNKAYLKYN